MRFQLIEPSDEAGIRDARVLFTEYQRELGLDLGFQGFQNELDTLPGKYAAPKGRLYVVYDQGEAIGCAALRPLEEGVCEVKRMYLRPDRRGEGIGRELLILLLKGAEMSGYERVRLDSLGRLTGAIRLYESLGFVHIPPYNENPEPDVVYMERLV
jgi:GNAT superfamily N-acetyltransferase